MVTQTILHHCLLFFLCWWEFFSNVLLPVNIKNSSNSKISVTPSIDCFRANCMKWKMSGWLIRTKTPGTSTSPQTDATPPETRPATSYWRKVLAIKSRCVERSRYYIWLLKALDISTQLNRNWLGLHSLVGGLTLWLLNHIVTKFGLYFKFVKAFKNGFNN